MALTSSPFNSKHTCLKQAKRLQAAGFPALVTNITPTSRINIPHVSRYPHEIINRIVRNGFRETAPSIIQPVSRNVFDQMASIGASKRQLHVEMNPIYRTMEVDDVRSGYCVTRNVRRDGR